MTEWTNLDERILLDGLWGLLPKMQILGLEMAARHVCFSRQLAAFHHSHLCTFSGCAFFCFSHAVMNRVSIVST